MYNTVKVTTRKEILVSSLTKGFFVTNHPNTYGFQFDWFSLIFNDITRLLS